MNNLTKKQIAVVIIVGLMFFIVIGGYLYNVYSKENEELELLEDELINEENYEQNNAESGKVIVHIAGEVNSPGIIEIDEGSRIADVVEKAEGFTEKADIGKINLAYEIQDGQKITIPCRNVDEINDEDIKEQEYIVKENGKGIIENSTEKERTVGKININKATQTELEQLPGIGPSTALKIVEYRKNNKFKKIEDVKNVSGIGDAKFDKIKEYIVV